MLKEGIGLRAYGQKDPLIEYKRESYEMFLDLNDNINQKILEVLWRTQFVEAPQDRRDRRRGTPSRMVTQHKDATNMGFNAPAQTQRPPGTPQEGEPRSGSAKQPVKADKKVGRNDPCPCGSGKKYKKCHGGGGGA